MKRDMDIIRQILFHVEEHNDLEYEPDDIDSEFLAYQITLAVEAGLLKATVHTMGDNTHFVEDVDTRLTWDGHEFLDAARNDTFWDNAKRIAIEKTGTATLPILTGLLAKMLQKAAGL